MLKEDLKRIDKLMAMVRPWLSNVGDNPLVIANLYGSALLRREKIYLYPDKFEEGIEGKYGTVEYIESAYKKGYSAIISNGELLGFKREKTV